MPHDEEFDGLVSRVGLYTKVQVSVLELREVLMFRHKGQWGRHKIVLTNLS